MLQHFLLYTKINKVGKVPVSAFYFYVKLTPMIKRLGRIDAHISTTPKQLVWVSANVGIFSYVKMTAVVGRNWLIFLLFKNNRDGKVYPPTRIRVFIAG